ncbi:DEAD/DEAH box helicase [Ralstonia solanacearum]|uniref:DEAD/DEAH box helicase n=1 Tax=Ralstonia solanacearum TaxID=305 RepID=UPI0018D1361B|nr:DEAD/DEAH box helicase [Ralstonia solanacearum]
MAALLNETHADWYELARRDTDAAVLRRSLSHHQSVAVESGHQFALTAAELSALALCRRTDQESEPQLRRVASDAFSFGREIDAYEDHLQHARRVLKTVAFGVLADRTLDAQGLISDDLISTLDVDEYDWQKKTWATVLIAWLLLIRKREQKDLEKALEKVVTLRASQAEFEEMYLNALTGPNDEAKSQAQQRGAWSLVGLYHLAKASERLATYLRTGQYEQQFNIREQLAMHFDRSAEAFEGAGDLEAHMLARVLSRCAYQTYENSLWTAARSGSELARRFVEQLVTRPIRPIFELLPPQRKALRDHGLLSGGHRAVIVNLPTSSGKTLIAQFRILQALNDYQEAQGWVAYVAPTRALVNQVCADLRRDFDPLGLRVERLSPALEFDAVEEAVLKEGKEGQPFRVLVSTPEKLDLLLRRGVQKDIGRPLSLVVVDEAHNLAEPTRGVKLEMLLATVNAEIQQARFLLLTPFIKNAKQVISWLDERSNNDVELGAEWKPNDRAVLLVTLADQQDTTEKEYQFYAETLHTPRKLLEIPDSLTLGRKARHLGMTRAAVSGSAGKIAAGVASVLQDRGPVILLCQQTKYTWSQAKHFIRKEFKRTEKNQDIADAQAFLGAELGSEFPLVELLDYGVAVHHSGMSDDAKVLVEWLVNRGHVSILCATTTIAQGINFPVSSVVLSTQQHPKTNKFTPAKDLSFEEFWNIAGRVGRAGQQGIGLVALCAEDNVRAERYEKFVQRNVLELNSSLISMVSRLFDDHGENVDLAVHSPKQEWSNFLQYLVHTYRQIGRHRFADQIEAVLRGTLGFRTLEDIRPDLIRPFVNSVRRYAEGFAGSEGALKLVDMTGFSLESVKGVLGRLRETHVDANAWNADTLFQPNNRLLKEMMGVLLQVPELRENLEAGGGGGADGNRLARILCSWVNGASIPDIAEEYFTTEKDQGHSATEKCCKAVFGKLAQAASWGLASLQAMTASEAIENMADEQKRSVLNIPSMALYGVRSNDALALRFAGVPRAAAIAMANSGFLAAGDNTTLLRAKLLDQNATPWKNALGESRGSMYQRVWKILEQLQ